MKDIAILSLAYIHKKYADNMLNLIILMKNNVTYIVNYLLDNV